MIFITGDTHSDVSRRLSAEAFPEQKTMTKDDYILICGDFGVVWQQEETKIEKYWLDWLNAKPFTTLFVDGNHENHARLDQMPVQSWHGGKVHYLRPSVIHLMRGQYFEDVDGCSIFSFGGARSHDIVHLLNPADPGFKDEKKSLNKGGVFYRIINETWWAREMPDKSEMDEGCRNLTAHDNEVDFIVSHEAPQSLFLHYYRMQPWLAQQEDPLRSYLEELHQTVEYRYWFFGHHHDNVRFNLHDMLIYEQIVRVN